MTPCDAHCVHNVQVAWLSANAPQQTSLLTTLFNNTRPVWKQTCGNQKGHKPQLRKLGTLAQRLITAPSPVLEQLAQFWASELPAAVASQAKTSGIQRANGEVDGKAYGGEMPVLSRLETVCLLAYLLDLALRSGSIGHADVLTCIRTSAIESLSDMGDVAVKDDGIAAAWLPLVNMVGAIAARYQLNADECEQALDIVHAIVSRSIDLGSLVFTTTVALVHVLRTRHSVDVSDCVKTLVRIATKAIGTSYHWLKLSAGELALTLVEAEPLKYTDLAQDAYLLAMDSNADVRGVWNKVARAFGNSWEPVTEATAFASQGRLASGIRSRAFDSRTVDSSFDRFFEDDAVVVIKALVDSCNAPKKQMVHCMGLSSEALECLSAVYDAILDPDKRRALRLGVHEITSLIVLLAGRRISAAKARECLDVASYLINIVRKATERRDGSKATFWILELIFQLCQPGRPAASLLLTGDDGVRILLLTTAAACSNIAFAVFVASLAVQTQYVAGPGGNKNNSSNGGSHSVKVNRITPEMRSRLATCAPWITFEKLLDCDLGDGISYIIGSNPGSDDIKEVYAALSTLELSEQLEQAGEDAASRLANYDICFEDDKVTSEYLDSHGSQLFLADRFLDGAISRATGRLAPVATGMHLRATQMYKQIVDVEATDAERLAGLEAAFAHDNRRAERMPELLQASFAAKKLEPALVSHWWHLYIASRVADSFNLPSHRASKATLSSDQRAVAAVLGKVTVSEHTEICFAQVPDTRTNLDAAAAVWSLGAADTVKAKEALLYLSSTNGVADIALASDVLLEGAGKIRYTASGTFDTASLLMTQLMTASTDQVPLLPADKPLTTRAVEQLAPYIPQLFAMLCAKRPEQASAALAILKQLARKAPDLIVFYAVVAARSLPAASRGGQMAMALVLQTFDAAMVADIQKFLALAGSVAVLPQERMRRVCVKAKTAHDRALAALARSPDDQRAASACEECLRPIYRMLAEYAATEIPVAASEAEFIAAIPRLQRLVDRLIPTAAGEAPGETETIWRQVFRLLATPASIAMAHVCPQLSDFRTAIPIPSLTSPTEPLFFEQTGTTVRVIGSKTRPKMLSLYLANKQGAVRRHRYILKGSEDLRIDECAIQVFVRLNRVIRCSVGSSETGDRISSLGVYNVVPIDTYGGLIQVVDDAPSLFHLYSSQAAAATDGQSEQSSAASGLHQVHTRHAHAVLTRFGLPRELPADKWPHEVSLAVYESLIKSNPAQPTLLHSYLMSNAQSASHMLALMQSTVRSIGMASVAGYVLGLGDRHLDNLLVSLRDGRLVHVDFNVCFDFGSVSHIPELVPFRMTPVLRFLCGSGSLTESPDAFALSRCFSAAARATLKFVRMDRKCLVGAIVSRSCFRPFMEWCCIEESRFKKQQQQQTLETRDSLDLRPERSPVLGSPYQAASAKDADILRTDEFIRANGLCPPAAFWPRRPVLGNAVAAVANSGDATTDAICSVSEIPYGWRIAREAVDRVDARLSYNATRTTDTTSSHNGKDVDDDDDLVAKQFGILWEAATSKDRLAKMFMGWAPWV